MKMDQLRLRNLGAFLTVATLLSGALFLPVYPAGAQALLEQEGTLRSAEGEHTFSGEAGQSVIITLTSPDFDTTLTLLDSTGAELAYNDDYARNLNSAIVYTLPTSGTYKVIARSLSGTGGSYEVVVADATAYDQAYFRGIAARQEGNYEAALTAFDEAIQLDSSNPAVHLDRADLLYALAQQLRPEEREAIVQSYQRAIELYEQAGDTENAQLIREQLMYLETPY
ncbi:MAG: tetratricopeptide repeat protein [Leptolyngbyaceae cyanobacterium RM1_406_9]|nr:tetratricopeptide repeat protein [Leptolyngbyaceae cyanobacterium RM1_406_9]